MNRVIFGLVACVLFSAGWAAGTLNGGKLPATYENAAIGLRMHVPSISKDATGVVAAFHFDISEEFTPNINIVSQHAMRIEEYQKKNNAQLEKLSMKLVQEEQGKVGDTQSITWEYAGSMKGRDLRFLATAIFAPDRVILVTCTATPKQYDSLKGAFREALASIELTSSAK